MLVNHDAIIHPNCPNGVQNSNARKDTIRVPTISFWVISAFSHFQYLYPFIPQWYSNPEIRTIVTRSDIKFIIIFSFIQAQSHIKGLEAILFIKYSIKELIPKVVSSILFLLIINNLLIIVHYIK